MANGSEMEIARPQGIARQELTAQELDTTNNAAAQAMATAARAEVEARIVAARRWPRDMDQVRYKLLAACKRPRFSEVAWYRKPIGGGFVEGLSVRFAEEAARDMGNLYTGSVVLAEDDTRRVVRVFAVDLEANNSRDDIVTVAKTVERKRLRSGQVAIRSRTNSAGEVVHTVEATDDEIAQRQGALVSKAWRNLVIKLVPGDILDEARDMIAKSRSGEFKSDPDAARKRIADAFGEINVSPEMLRRVLGHELATCSAAEIETLRGYYSAIKSGEATWAEIEREAGAAPESAGPASTGDLLKADPTARGVAAIMAASDPEHVAAAHAQAAEVTGVRIGALDEAKRKRLAELGAR